MNNKIIDLEVSSEELADGMNQAALRAGCFMSISSIGPVGMTLVTKAAYASDYVDDEKLGLSNQEECALDRLSCRKQVLASANRIARFRNSLGLPGAEVKRQIEEAAQYVPERWRAMWLRTTRRTS